MSKQYNNLLNTSEFKSYLESFADEATVLDMYKLHYNLGLYYLFYSPYRKCENEFMSIFRYKLNLNQDKYKIMNDMDNIVKVSRPKILGGIKWYT